MSETGSSDAQDNPPKPAESGPSGASIEFEQGLKKHGFVLPIPDVGQRLHATLRVIGEESSFADYGGRSEAVIETSHLRGPDGELTVKVGDRIEAYVIANEESVVLAPSLTPASNERLRTLQAAQQSGTPVSGKVSGVNAGGLDVEIAGIRAFCPASQIDLKYCPDPSVYVGQSHDFLILEFGEGGRRIVVSRRALLQRHQEEVATRLRGSLHVGEVREGTVVRLEPFGAFIDLGGLDALVHVSEIGHERIAHPSESLKIGDKVRTQILEIGRDAKGRDRISLSIKAARQDPWLTVSEVLREDQTLTGKIVRLAEFGAFVRLLPGVEGLVHVSEIRDERITHPREALKEGEEVDVRILKIDTQRRRISLTMRHGSSSGGRAPRVGETVEGTVRAHKPYGIFIDLPSYGPRVSGLLPLEETGIPRGGDLTRRFPQGEKLDVMVQQIDEKGRLRLAIPSGAPQAASHLGSPGTSRAFADALRRALEQGQKGREDS